jgi:hypothetical protein
LGDHGLQQVIQLRFAALEFTSDGAVTRFPDGSTWGAQPHPEMPHYQHLAFDYGHEGDTLAYCRVHELAHHVIAEGFGTHSFVLWALAHGEQPTPMIAAAEESLAMNLHRYAMKNENPFVDGVDWPALKARFLGLLNPRDEGDIL